MILKSLLLKNCRVHQNSNIDFADNLNFIIGGNGQGKTTILETIYYLCTTKNFKSNSDSEFIQFGKNEFEINGLFKDLTEDKIRIYFSQVENKKYYLQNNKLTNRSAEVIGKFPIVILSTNDHAITQGSPAERRKFVDQTISQASKNYLETLLDYNKTLRQKSTLLNQINDSYNSSLLDELDAWNEKLILTGSELIQYRVKFIEEFKPYLINVYMKIMDEEEIPFIEYNFLNTTNSLGISIQDIENLFSNLVQERKNEELRRRTNLVGPHRDEFIFKINDNNLRTYGSQGQHKTFQVALRFAEFFYLKGKLDRTPIFLLDDVFGELDTHRAIKISNALREVGQAFITMTDFSNFSYINLSDNDLTIKVTNGKVSYETSN
ncbi:MAG: DNA replication/repair protein RecF [Ignavibacterium sp.]